MIINSLPSEDDIVLFTRKDLERDLTDHETAFPFLESYSELKISDYDYNLEMKFDTLYITWTHWIRFSKEQIKFLKLRLKKAKRIVLLYDAQFGTFWQRFRQQIRDIINNFQLVSSLDEICYMTVYPVFDLFALFRRRYCLSVGPKLEYLFIRENMDYLCRDYEIKNKRGVFLFVSGEKASSSYRQELVDYLVSALNSNGNYNLTGQTRGAPDNKRNVLWLAGKKRIISDKEYIEALGNADFTLCFNGTSWTTRPFEALLRGSIPILGDDVLPFYDLKWENGKNCMVVKTPQRKDCWFCAINKAARFSQEEIKELRKNVYHLRREYLLPDVFRKRLSLKLGYH
ncbi:MAG: hypothetical protein NTW13_02475 [Candidatus Omnitrophica bacterium]|nr:hypothetical protein [Candidatus Omnitrophota bacterium]